MKFISRCQISGQSLLTVDFFSDTEEIEVGFTGLAGKSIDLASGRNTTPDFRAVHPVFNLKRSALLHFMPRTEENPAVVALFFQAFWNSSGLIHWNCPELPSLNPTPFTLLEKNLYLSRLLKILTWIDGYGRELPSFNFTAENRMVLNSGFLRELESIRDTVIKKTKASVAIAALPVSLDAQVSSRAARGSKVLTPQMAKRIASVIGWTSGNEEIAISLLTSDGAAIVKQLASGLSFLGDITNLLDDLESTSWQSVLRIKALDHLREVVDVITLLRGLSSEEKEAFTAMPHAAKITTATMKSITERFSSPSSLVLAAEAKLQVLADANSGLSVLQILAKRKMITSLTAKEEKGAE